MFPAARVNVHRQKTSRNHDKNDRKKDSVVTAAGVQVLSKAWPFLPVGLSDQTVDVVTPITP